MKVKVSGYLFVAGCCLTLALPFAAQDKNLALTPPMGWNSWNHFAAKVDDKAARTAADAMVASGMKDAGYVYINIDDTWEAKRDTQGVIQPNEKFPDMKSLADYVHSNGLKLASTRLLRRRPAPALKAAWAMGNRTPRLMRNGGSTI